mgnify:CR=1 FL=1
MFCNSQQVYVSTGNYLCLQRFIERVEYITHSYSAEEAKFLIRLIVWLEDSITGDQGELTLWAHERKLWDSVSAWDSENGGDCLFRRQGRCFVNAARRYTQSSHLVLTNHAFLLADAARDSGFLAHSSRLIIDEAHKLEDEATNQFGGNLDQKELDELAIKIQTEIENSRICVDGSLFLFFISVLDFASCVGNQ